MARDESLDVAKGIGILLIVLGHAKFPLTHFIYLFHVPFFFVAAGYVCSDRHSADLRAVGNFTLRRLRSLYLPFAGFGVFFILLHNVLCRWGVYRSPLWTACDFRTALWRTLLFQETGGQLTCARWFLSCLFFAGLGCVLVKALTRSSASSRLWQILVAVLAMAAAFWLQQARKTACGFDLVLVTWPLFLMGMQLREFHLPTDWKSTSALMVLSALVLWGCNMRGELELSQRIYTGPLFLLLVSLAGWFLVKGVSQLLVLAGAGTIPAFLGQNTIPVLCLHFSAFKLAALVQIRAMELPASKLSEFPVISPFHGWWILYGLFGIGVPLALLAVWRRLWRTVLRFRPESRR